METLTQASDAISHVGGPFGRTMTVCIRHVRSYRWYTIGMELEPAVSGAPNGQSDMFPLWRWPRFSSKTSCASVDNLLGLPCPADIELEAR